MSEITLTKIETTLLIGAAGANGRLIVPSTTKAATRDRLLGRFLRDGLVVADDEAHRLTPAGYRAVGLRSPRRARRVDATGDPAGMDAERPLAGKRLVVDLLRRPDGASLAELVDATGWLPHTTRAALCRLRQAGQIVIRGPRPEGGSAYWIEPEPAAPRDRSRATVLAA